MTAPIDWLLDGEPWIEYRTRRDLLGESEDEPRVRAARLEMLDDPRIKRIIEELSAWPGPAVSSHKSAGQLLHKLTFIADLGITIDDPGINTIVGRILGHQSPEGPFRVVMNIPSRYGGTGEDQLAWALCDAPLVAYALLKFGLQDEPRVVKAIEYLAALVRDSGWPCAVSPELGKFRGPGRKDDPCPFATLAVLKVLSEVGAYRDNVAVRAGTNALLELWSASLVRHPYMFFMGKDFRKLKAPFVWYDILHVLEVLSKFEWLSGDDRLLNMASVLRQKADQHNCFTPESVWTAWKDWEFGQKKEPSRWLTFLAWRIVSRLEPARA